LVVNDGIDQIEGLISDLRNIVKYFKRSPCHLYKFVEVANDYAIEVGNDCLLMLKQGGTQHIKCLTLALSIGLHLVLMLK